jgi:hypothetical protein
MKWNVNRIICKLSVISRTTVLAVAILMSMPRINLSRGVYHNSVGVPTTDLRPNVMFCGADGSSVGCNLVRGEGNGL